MEMYPPILSPFSLPPEKRGGREGRQDYDLEKTNLIYGGRFVHWGCVIAFLCAFPCLLGALYWDDRSHKGLSSWSEIYYQDASYAESSSSSVTEVDQAKLLPAALAHLIYYDSSLFPSTSSASSSCYESGFQVLILISCVVALVLMTDWTLDLYVAFRNRFIEIKNSQEIRGGGGDGAGMVPATADARSRLTSTRIAAAPPLSRRSSAPVVAGAAPADGDSFSPEEGGGGGGRAGGVFRSILSTSGTAVSQKRLLSTLPEIVRGSSNNTTNWARGSSFGFGSGIAPVGDLAAGEAVGAGQNLLQPQQQLRDNHRRMILLSTKNVFSSKKQNKSSSPSTKNSNNSTNALSWIPYVSVPAIVLALVIPNIFLFSHVIFGLSKGTAAIVSGSNGASSASVPTASNDIITMPVAAAAAAIVRLRIYLGMTTLKSIMFPVVCVLSSAMCSFSTTGTRIKTVHRPRRTLVLLSVFLFCVVVSCLIRFYTINFIILNPSAWRSVGGGTANIQKMGVYAVAPVLAWISNAFMFIAVVIAMGLLLVDVLGVPVPAMFFPRDAARLPGGTTTPEEHFSLIYQFAATAMIVARFIIAIAINSSSSSSAAENSLSCLRVDSGSPILYNLAWAFDSISLSPCLFHDPSSSSSSWGPGSFIIVEICLMVLTIWLPRRILALAKYHELQEALKNKDMYHKYSSHELRTPLNTASMGMVLLKEDLTRLDRAIGIMDEEMKSITAAAAAATARRAEQDIAAMVRGGGGGGGRGGGGGVYYDGENDAEAGSSGCGTGSNYDNEVEEEDYPAPSPGRRTVTIVGGGGGAVGSAAVAAGGGGGVGLGSRRRIFAGDRAPGEREGGGGVGRQGSNSIKMATSFSTSSSPRGGRPGLSTTTMLQDDDAAAAEDDDDEESPMAIIKSLVEVVDDVNNSCEAAVSILNEMLIFDKVKSGKLKLDKEAVGPWQYLVNTVRPLKLQATQKGLQFTIKSLINLGGGCSSGSSSSGIFLAPRDSGRRRSSSSSAIDETHEVFIDSSRISQVVRNLLSNAVKFTPAGGKITITATIVKKRTDDDNEQGEEQEGQLPIAVHNWRSNLLRRVLNPTRSSHPPPHGQPPQQQQQQQRIAANQTVGDDDGAAALSPPAAIAVAADGHGGDDANGVNTTTTAAASSRRDPPPSSSFFTARNGFMARQQRRQASAAATVTAATAAAAGVGGTVGAAPLPAGTTGSGNGSGGTAQQSQLFFRIEVRDSGSGISSENMKQLFGQYVQFNAGKLQKGGGSGLGLWISKAIVELHDGCMGAESQGEGMGTMFFVELPLFAKAGGDIRMQARMISSSSLYGGGRGGGSSFGSLGSSDRRRSNQSSLSFFDSDMGSEIDGIGPLQSSSPIPIGGAGGGSGSKQPRPRSPSSGTVTMIRGVGGRAQPLQPHQQMNKVNPVSSPPRHSLRRLGGGGDTPSSHNQHHQHQQQQQLVSPKHRWNRIGTAAAGGSSNSSSQRHHQHQRSGSGQAGVAGGGGSSSSFTSRAARNSSSFSSEMAAFNGMAVGEFSLQLPLQSGAGAFSPPRSRSGSRQTTATVAATAAAAVIDEGVEEEEKQDKPRSSSYSRFYSAEENRRWDWLLGHASSVNAMSPPAATNTAAVGRVTSNSFSSGDILNRRVSGAAAVVHPPTTSAAAVAAASAAATTAAAVAVTVAGSGPLPSGLRRDTLSGTTSRAPYPNPNPSAGTGAHRVGGSSAAADLPSHQQQPHHYSSIVSSRGSSGPPSTGPSASTSPRPYVTATGAVAVAGTAALGAAAAAAATPLLSPSGVLILADDHNT